MANRDIGSEMFKYGVKKVYDSLNEKKQDNLSSTNAGAAIDISTDSKISVKYDNSTIKVNKDGELYTAPKIQSDWNEADTDSPAYIKNKPTIPSLTGYATEQWVEGKGYLTKNAVETVNGETPDETGNINIDAYDIDLETTSTLSSTNVQSAIDELDEKVNAKQDELTAGDRISIDANNVISADAQVFVAKYGETTYSEISAAYNAGKSVICNYGNRQYRLYIITATAAIFNTSDYADRLWQYRIAVNTQNAWSVLNVDTSETLIVNADYDASTQTISNLDKTFAEIEAAYNGTASAPKKAVFLRAGNLEFELKNFVYDAQARPDYDAANFVANVGQATLSYVMYRRAEWSTLNIFRTVSSISEQATNQETPTALAVKNYVDDATDGLASETWVQGQGFLVADADDAPTGVEMQNVYKDTEGNLVTPVGSGGSGDTTDVLKYTAQSLTYAQKAQARTNIGALGESDTQARDIYYHSLEYAGQPTNVEEALDSLAQQSYFDSTDQYAQYKSQTGGDVSDYLRQLGSDGRPLLYNGLYYISEYNGYYRTYARLLCAENYGYLVVEQYYADDGWVHKCEYKLQNGEWTQLKFESLGEEALIELHENNGNGTLIRNVAEPSGDSDAANKKYVDDAVGDVSDSISSIEGKIPTQATSENQLADKDFVNSSIENVAAYFITKDAAGNPFATKAELNSATVFYSGGVVRVPTRNDYTVVLADESKTISATGENPTTRYIYDNDVWSFQYIVNNSGLTAAQWAAVNSGITAAKVEEIDTLAPKQWVEDKGYLIANADVAPQNMATQDVYKSGNKLVTNDKVFQVKYGQTEYQDIIDAYNADKFIICSYGNKQYRLHNIDNATSQIAFITNGQTGNYAFWVTASGQYIPPGGTSLQPTIYKNREPIATTLNDNSYPSSKAVREYVESVTGDIRNLISISYSNLVNIRDAGELIPGMQYRITDYECTVANDDEAQAVSHTFDIIVTADDEYTLNENARACLHENDNYYSAGDCKANLSAWELKYSLDNDANRFAWADEVNGKGVIYWLKDDWGNECPYDFKQIQFKRYKIKTCEKSPSLVGQYAAKEHSRDITIYGEYEIPPIFCYTFNWLATDGTVEDLSVKQCSHISDDVFQHCYDNKIQVYSEVDYEDDNNLYKIFLNNISIICTEEYERGDDYGCYSNTFGNGCYSNTFGNDCNSNTFGDGCINNTFGASCRSNTFGDSCRSNTFGDSCHSNTFDKSCFSNTFGYNCRFNTFGNDCYNNTFGYNCRFNTFGNFCAYTTFGNECHNNTFGASCRSNTFGNYCCYNTFGNGCYSNTFGAVVVDGYMTSKSPKNYYRYNIFDDGVSYTALDTPTDPTDDDPPSYCQNYHVLSGINNTTGYITVDELTRDNAYCTYIGRKTGDTSAIVMSNPIIVQQANSTTLGGIKADARDANTDTQEVKIDTTSGKLYVPQSNSSFVFDVTKSGSVISSSTSFAQISSAYAAKVPVFARYGKFEYELVYLTDTSAAHAAQFSAQVDGTFRGLLLEIDGSSNDTWSEILFSPVVTIDGEGSSLEYPTTSAVVSFVNTAISTAIGDTASQLTALDNLIGGDGE